MKKNAECKVFNVRYIEMKVLYGSIHNIVM